MMSLLSTRDLRNEVENIQMDIRRCSSNNSLATFSKSDIFLKFSGPPLTLENDIQCYT